MANMYHGLRAVANRPYKTKVALLKLIFRSFDAQNDHVGVVQVGAHDGQLGDPISQYWDNDHWHGVLIEPHPVYFSELKELHGKNPRIKLVKAAATSSKRSMTLYHLSEAKAEDCPAWLRTAASTDKKRMEQALERANERNGLSIPKSVIKHTKVSGRRLDEILKQNTSLKPNLLLLDVSGHENAVLKGFDLSKFDFKLIVVGHSTGDPEDQEDIVKHLTDAGYIAFAAGAEIIAFKEGEFQIPLEAILHFNGMRRLA